MRLRFKAVVAAAVLSALAVTTVACAPEDDTVSAPSFAHTSASVVFAADSAYPINLIFVAADGDPIWDELSGLAITDEVSVGPGQFELIRGEGPDGYSLGNITFDLDIPDDGVEFSSVGLVYGNRTERVQVGVGSWSLRNAPVSDFATADTNAEVAAMADCTTANLPVPTAVASISDIHTESDDVELKEASLNIGASTIAISLTCDGDSDFYVISPVLDYNDTNGKSMTTRFSPIAIGFQDIDEEDIRRIQRR